MSFTSIPNPRSLLGYPVFDTDGAELGEIAGVYLDRGTGEPEWAALWLADGGVTVVPLAEADLYEDSAAIPYTRDQLEHAPYQRDELARELSEDEEEELYRYYHEGSAQVATAARQAAADAASTAKRQGERLASTAKGQGGQLASTAKKQTQRVATTAKGQGRHLVQSAAGQANEVVGAAKEEAARVAEEAAGEARGVLEETRSSIEEQAAAGAERLADNLRRLGEQALALAEGRPEEAAMVREYVRQGGERVVGTADRVRSVADDVQSRGLGVLVEDLQHFARRRPGVFLLGTAVVGIAAGRAMRGASAQSDAPADQGQEAPATSDAPRSGVSRRRPRTTGGR